MQAFKFFLAEYAQEVCASKSPTSIELYMTGTTFQLDQYIRITRL